MWPRRLGPGLRPGLRLGPEGERHKGAQWVGASVWDGDPRLSGEAMIFPTTFLETTVHAAARSSMSTCSGPGQGHNITCSGPGQGQDRLWC